MLSFVALAALFPAALVAATCEPSGIDYQDGQKYYVSKHSHSHFTAKHQFSGCAGAGASAGGSASGKAYGTLVDPNGDETECSMTPMSYDEPQQMVCPGWTYDNMWTGDWSVIVHWGAGVDSNPKPTSYQRDFHVKMIDDKPAYSYPEPKGYEMPAGFQFPHKRHEEPVPYYAQPSTLSKVYRNATSAAPKYQMTSSASAGFSSSSYAQPTTTIETTVTSHVKQTVTVSATNVPYKPGKPQWTGWNATVTVTSYYGATGTGVASHGPMPTAYGYKVRRDFAPAGPQYYAPAPQYSASNQPSWQPSEPAPYTNDHGGEFEGSFGGSFGGSFSFRYRQAIAEGRTPDAELKGHFVEERRKALHGY